MSLASEIAEHLVAMGHVQPVRRERVEREVNLRLRDAVECPRERTAMTPCVARDGAPACADDGVCVGCGHHPADLLRDLVPRYIALKET